MLLLSELLKDWPCTVIGGKFRVSVTGITENAINVKPGYVFVARRGNKDDGALYINEAIKGGAVAIVVDRSNCQPVLEGIPVITVPNCRHFLSHASAVLSGSPSEQLTVIAVTGTNGKTTVSHFIGQILKALGVRAAVIGTTGISIDGARINYNAPQMTSLPAEYLHPLLRKCKDDGVTHIVLEASSLGLSTYRLEHCKIDIGLLLNVGTDHYEEHGGRQFYIDAKTKLVKKAKQIIVNRDDEVCVQMAKSAPQTCIYFGRNLETGISLNVLDEKVIVKIGEEQGELCLPMLGDFNQMNAVAAISALHALGYDLGELLTHMSFLKLPEGRMQQLKRAGVTVVIDYAHTPDALEAVLCSLWDTCKGRLITVFGCGGERDKGKREEMGEIATLYSSCVFVTSDNPRNENPLAIIGDIMAGFNDSCFAVKAEPNRELAIQEAISSANVGDVVLIAGKGHEKTQHTADGIFPFSDKEVAERALFEKFKGQKRGND